MEKIFFSSTNLSFYPEALKKSYESGTGWPDDAVEITPEQWETYIQIPPPGQFLSAGEDGMPCWMNLPPLTLDELIAVAEQERQALLQHAYSVIADWRTELALGIISDDDKELLIEWMQYIKDVKAVDVSTAPDIEWPVKPPPELL